jgi:hypothetical protein
MKKIALLLTGMLVLMVLPIFAQTGQITLQVDWIPEATQGMGRLLLGKENTW